ncbi:MAG: hypothetical protein FJ149_09585 [Euryarchaeota archaeon]|nr:hypothetical protein [Euryarchaeota archaeon]
MPCVVCHKPVPPRCLYCPRHRRFGLLASDDQSILEIRFAMIAGWVPALDGFVCEYCGRLLDETDPGRDDYAGFDHIVPGERRLATCCRRCNSMKNALTGIEFRTVVPALADLWLEGVPFKKDIVQFERWDWRRLAPAAPAPPRGVAPFEAQLKKYADCLVCHGILYPRSRYCARCRRFITSQRENAARCKAMVVSWDPVAKGFRCLYTGVLLDLHNPKSPWYLTFDHLVPGRAPLAVCAAWVNRMKGSMAEPAFRALIPNLARHMRTGAPLAPVRIRHPPI